MIDWVVEMDWEMVELVRVWLISKFPFYTYPTGYLGSFKTGAFLKIPYP